MVSPRKRRTTPRAAGVGWRDAGGSTRGSTRRRATPGRPRRFWGRRCPRRTPGVGTAGFRRRTRRTPSSPRRNRARCATGPLSRSAGRSFPRTGTRSPRGGDHRSLGRDVQEEVLTLISTDAAGVRGGHRHDSRLEGVDSRGDGRVGRARGGGLGFGGWSFGGRSSGGRRRGLGDCGRVGGSRRGLCSGSCVERGETARETGEEGTRQSEEVAASHGRHSFVP
jgi:hypothetical protein